MPRKLTEDEVRHVARLSRLRLSDEEAHQFTGRLAAVLEYFSRLDELDVSNVEPMAHSMDVTNVLRPDVPAAPLPVEAALANAPDRDDPFFKVPKVLGDIGGSG